jgi:chromosomal replication initiator protein
MQAWENFLQVLEKDLGAETVKKWLRPLRVLHFDACNLYLEAQDSFQVLWFEEHVRPTVESKLYNNNYKKIKVHLTQNKEANVVQKEQQKLSKAQEKVEKQLFDQRIIFASDELDSHSRLDTFVVNDQNLLAYKLLSELTGYSSEIQDQGSSKIELTTFNPIYLHGPTGSGKTHLLIATQSLLRQQGLRVVYTQAKTFIENVVRALRLGEIQKFRDVYRCVDVLLVDGVQAFSKKGATQEEFFHTFNTLHVQGKLILLAADVSPGELTSIEPRLVSRFEWGISLGLEPVEGDDLVLVAHKKAESFGLSLDRNVCAFLCEHLNSPKSVSQAIEALVLRTHLQRQSGEKSWKVMDISSVKVILKDLFEKEKKFVLTPDKIIDTVANHYGVPSQEILGRSQNRECALPRQVAMHLCRDLLKMPYVKIGDIFSRNHSTVMSSIRQVKGRLGSKESQFCSSVVRIQKEIEHAKCNV